MNPKITKKDLIIYLFKKSRVKRLENTKNYPSEFFYGFLELKKKVIILSYLKKKI